MYKIKANLIIKITDIDLLFINKKNRIALIMKFLYY